MLSPSSDPERRRTRTKLSKKSRCGDAGMKRWIESKPLRALLARRWATARAVSDAATLLDEPPQEGHVFFRLAA